MTAAAGLRQMLAATHRLGEDGVLAAAGAAPFAYSDGAEHEAFLAAVMAEARDLAVGSRELAERIRDWPSQYHLSPARQNLLRPVAHAMRGAILEVGAGCGAITRQLGESGAAVLAVEGSRARAAIAAARCRDLENVVVVCDHFARLPLFKREERVGGVPITFDLVTLIGVLEYSPMYGEGDDPVQEMLAQAMGLLAPGGIVAIAIENRLGVKYLAGAHEDHFAEAYAGFSGRYGPKTPVTFGEAELRERLAHAGLVEQQCLYPFPDYKMPSVIVTERGFAEPGFNTADVIATSMRRHDPREGRRAFSEALARDVFVRNGMGGATANSFLFLAGRDAAARERMADPSLLAFGYSTDRDRAYAKAMTTRAAGSAIRVERKPLYDAKPPADAPVRQVLDDEDYVRGEVMSRGLERLVAHAGWTVEDVAAWMRPVADLLASRAKDGILDPAMLDCTPFNVIRREPDGALVPFDLEWVAANNEPPSVARMVFRGLWNGLARVDDVRPPAAGTPLDVCTLALAVMARLGHPTSEEQALAWIRGEHVISGTAGGKVTLPEWIPRFNVGGLSAAAASTVRVQVYYHAPDEIFVEPLSVAQDFPIHAGRVRASLKLPARDKPYARVRVDPMNVPGFIRLERVAIHDARGEILWETRTFRAPDVDRVSQLRDLSAVVPAATGTVFLSEGVDPNFELMLPAAALARLRGGGEVVVEMGKLSDGERGTLERLAS